MDNRLAQQSCEEFTGQLASKAPVPGGGGAAALMGALSAALCEMAGNLTAGKKKYAAREEDLRRMLADAEALRLRFLALIDADAAAFELLARAYAMPKDSPDYAAVMARVTLDACRAPLEMMQCCCRGIELLEEMRGSCSVLMISDVGCGAAAARAALEAAFLNVLINTRSLPGNREALLLEQRAEQLLNQYGPRAQNITASVVEALRGKNNG